MRERDELSSERVAGGGGGKELSNAARVGSLSPRSNNPATRDAAVDGRTMA